MEYEVPQTVQNCLWPSAKKQKSLTWQRHTDAIWRATGKVRGWFRRLDEKQRAREFDFCEERRLERLRIAGELHDTLLQGFLGASLIVGITLQNMSENSPGTASLRRAAQLMQRAIDEGRAVLQGLRSSPASLDSLEREFSDLLREAAPSNRVQARILVIGQQKAVKAEIQKQIYLIGREALVNVLRHANATAIEVEIAYLRNHLRVVVRDNGCASTHKSCARSKRLIGACKGCANERKASARNFGYTADGGLVLRLKFLFPAVSPRLLEFEKYQPPGRTQPSFIGPFGLAKPCHDVLFDLH